MIAFSRMLIVCRASFSLSLLSPNDNPHLPRMLHNNVIRFCVYILLCVCELERYVLSWIKLSWAAFSSLFLFSICKLDCYYLPTSICLILSSFIWNYFTILYLFFCSLFHCFSVGVSLSLLFIVCKKVMLSLRKHHPNFDSIFGKFDDWFSNAMHWDALSCSSYFITLITGLPMWQKCVCVFFF